MKLFTVSYESGDTVDVHADSEEAARAHADHEATRAAFERGSKAKTSPVVSVREITDKFKYRTEQNDLQLGRDPGPGR